MRLPYNLILKYLQMRLILELHLLCKLKRIIIMQKEERASCQMIDVDVRLRFFVDPVL